MSAEEELRFGDDSSELYYQHSDIGVSYSGLAKWLELGANYRLVLEKKNKDWLYTNTPHLNATFKTDLFGRINLSDRNRLEYRDREKADDSWRYSNKFTVKAPFEIKNFDFEAYVADEIFLDFDIGEFNKNRLSPGICFKLTKNLSLDVYYMWELDKKSKHWLNYNILGTQIKLSF